MAPWRIPVKFRTCWRSSTARTPPALLQDPTAKHWRDLVFITMGDQAHNNGPESLQGKMSCMVLVAWRTWRIQKKSIISSMAFASGRCGRICNPRDPLVQNVERVLCTNSGGGVEVNESPLLGQRLRAALQAFRLRDNLARVGCELT